MPDLTIHADAPQDADALARLAWLDVRRRVTGRALVAKRDGYAIAAIALTSGAIVADPSYPTAAAVRALRRRRYEVLRQGGDVAPLRSLLPQTVTARLAVRLAPSRARQSLRVAVQATGHHGHKRFEPDAGSVRVLK